MNHTKLKEKQTFFTKYMVCMFFTIQTHYHLCSSTDYYYYYYLSLIVFFCSCDGVYFGLVFEQRGQPISSLY